MWLEYRAPLPVCWVTWLFSSSLDAPCQVPSSKCCLSLQRQSLAALLFTKPLALGSWPHPLPPGPHSTPDPHSTPQAPKVNCGQTTPILLFFLRTHHPTMLLLGSFLCQEYQYPHVTKGLTSLSLTSTKAPGPIGSPSLTSLGKAKEARHKSPRLV